MNKWIFSLLILVLSVGCGRKKAQEEPLRPVLAETITETTQAPSRYYSGFSKAEKLINISFRVPGLITEYPIEVGEKLEVGQLIAKLDEHDYKLKLNTALSALEEAHAEMRKATSQYRRIKALYESESASRNEFDEARAAAEAAKANVIGAQSEVDLAEQQLSYTVLRNDQPYCEVATVDAEINENVRARETIASLNCGAIVEVEIAIPETEISSINVGEHVKVFFQAIPGKGFDATVKEVGVSASGGTAFPVTVALDERNKELRTGMAAKVIFYSEPLDKSIIVVPLEAVGEDTRGHFVYIYKPSHGGVGYVHKKKVKIGQLLPYGITITSGLKPGDMIVTAGVRFLHNGMKVKLLEHNTVSGRSK